MLTFHTVKRRQTNWTLKVEIAFYSMSQEIVQSKKVNSTMKLSLVCLPGILCKKIRENNKTSATNLRWNFLCFPLFSRSLLVCLPASLEADKRNKPKTKMYHIYYGTYGFIFRYYFSYHFSLLLQLPYIDYYIYLPPARLVAISCRLCESISL